MGATGPSGKAGPSGPTGPSVLTVNLLNSSSVITAVVGNVATVNFDSNFKVTTPAAGTALVSLAAGASTGGGAGVTVTGLTYASSTYTANGLNYINTSAAAGYIILSGSGFQQGAQVYFGSGNPYAYVSTSTQLVSATQLYVALPMVSAGTYDMTLVNTDGTNAIKPRGLIFAGSAPTPPPPALTPPPPPPPAVQQLKLTCPYPGNALPNNPVYQSNYGPVKMFTISGVSSATINSISPKFPADLYMSNSSGSGISGSLSIPSGGYDVYLTGGVTAPQIATNYTFNVISVINGVTTSAQITINFSVEVKFGFFLGQSGLNAIVRQGDGGASPINFGWNDSGTKSASMIAITPGDTAYNNAAICKLFFAAGSGTAPSYSQTMYFSTRSQNSYPVTGTNLYRTAPYGIEQLWISPLLTGTYAAGSTPFLRSQASALSTDSCYNGNHVPTSSLVKDLKSNSTPPSYNCALWTHYKMDVTFTPTTINVTVQVVLDTSPTVSNPPVTGFTTMFTTSFSKTTTMTSVDVLVSMGLSGALYVW
jgi:hypothetical protein